jgi:uncharacterized protein (TIGR02246 family)
MDERLQRLLDENAIRALTAAYSDAVTHLDAERAAGLYAEDGCVSIDGHALLGRAAIEAGMRESFSAFRLLRLIAHGGLVRVEGNAAEARWSTLELTVRHDNEALNVIFGRYEDRLVRAGDGWAFARRTFSLAGRTQVETGKLQLRPDFCTSLVPSDLS